MRELLKKILGKSFTKLTTYLAVAVTVLGLLADHILPAASMVIDTLSPGQALALGAVITWVGRLRGILAEVKSELSDTQP